MRYLIYLSGLVSLLVPIFSNIITNKMRNVSKPSLSFENDVILQGAFCTNLGSYQVAGILPAVAMNKENDTQFVNFQIVAVEELYNVAGASFR